MRLSVTVTVSGRTTSSIGAPGRPCDQAITVLIRINSLYRRGSAARKIRARYPVRNMNEELVSDRVHRWLLDPGSIYKSTAARLADPSIQNRRVERAAEIGKHWPELSVARKRAVLTALIERIEVSVDQIDFRLRPPRLGTLLDGDATPSQGVGEEESELLSVPVRLRRAGREIRIVMDGTDPFATAKPDARLIKLLLRARRFNAVLTQSEGIAFPVTRQALRSALMPIINSMSATGVVSLPGMMTGQILGGVPPAEAVKYQILVMFMIAGGTGLGAVTAVLGGVYRLTDGRHRLRLDRLHPPKPG